MKQTCIQHKDKSTIQYIQEFIQTYGGSSQTHLGFLGDKDIFVTKNKKAAFLYRKNKDKFVVLGDALGENSIEALLEFEQYARSMKCVPCFYQITENMKDVYIKAGYSLFKLGEEAVVELEQYEITGKKGAKLRTKRNRLIRQGFEFEVTMPEHDLYFLENLKKVSDEWLNGREELSFSVSSFHYDYVSNFPVASLKNSDGEIIAFATLAIEGEIISIDLMRHKRDMPYGAMDMLFISILFWAKEKGFVKCSLGMAPLANVGIDANATLYEKSAKLIFKYGNSIYNFKGLLTYKSKFANCWEPKYLAYKPYSFIMVVNTLYKIVHGKKTFDSIIKFKKPVLKKTKIS